VSSVNHSTDCSTLINIRRWYNRPVIVSVTVCVVLWSEFVSICSWVPVVSGSSTSFKQAQPMPRRQWNLQANRIHGIYGDYKELLWESEAMPSMNFGYLKTSPS
jgi:hypothetical protein